MSVSPHRRAAVVSLVCGLLVLPSLAGCQAGTHQAGGGSGSGQAGAAAGAPADTAPSPSGGRTSGAGRHTDCTRAKCVMLTFDDGPSPLTPTLLDTLTRERVPATFFLLGSAVKTHPETVRRMALEGFEIGNHTTDHVNLAGATEERISSQLATTQTLITQLTGRTPTLMRPPYGARTARVDAVAGRQRLAVVNWSTGPEDWVHRKTADIVRLTLERTTPGAILLFHDTHRWTVDAQPAIIAGLRKQGYTLVTATDLIGRPRPGKLYPSG